MKRGERIISRTRELPPIQLEGGSVAPIVQTLVMAGAHGGVATLACVGAIIRDASGERRVAFN